ncbi:MAG: YvcK family protein [Candidatus Pacebacteria bacterium]|nr:YvcK family protein [Candidatus Paceibacterota bacterium]MBP9866994.1 YvcK family protein [Candidatus Paceibacterota bacterium]
MKSVVTIGGGTGSYTILSGLKDIPNISLTSLVSMADDGGSTGVLRDELGVLPPGDVRQCLIALSEHTDIVRSLMGYRFSEGTLTGHSFGNIFLAALEKVTGDFGSGVEIASEILKVKGKVIPITTNKAELRMIMKDDSCLKGEHCINSSDI